MIIREAADMRLFAATSKAVRELAINSFYELEIGDSFDDSMSEGFGRRDAVAAPWVASNVSWPSSLKRVRINYRRLMRYERYFLSTGGCLSRRSSTFGQSPEVLKLRDHEYVWQRLSGAGLEVGTAPNLLLMLKEPSRLRLTQRRCG